MSLVCGLASDSATMRIRAHLARGESGRAVIADRGPRTEGQQRQSTGKVTETKTLKTQKCSAFQTLEYSTRVVVREEMCRMRDILSSY